MIYSTLLGGSMGSRLFDEIREQRGLAYSVSASPHAYADVPVLQLSAGLESGKCVEAYRRMRDIVTELRERRADRGRGRAGARLRRRRPRDRASRTAARWPATPPSRRSSTARTVDPDAAIDRLDEVTFDEVREVAAGVDDELSVACVGPHTVEELEAA